MKKIRQKGKNFTNQEISLLLDILEKNLAIIENKKTDANTVKLKNEVWMETTAIFNANNNNEERTLVQLKVFYDNFKRKKRKENIEANQNKSADGSFARQNDPYGKRLMKMLDQLKSDTNTTDDNNQNGDSNSFDLEIHENIKQENNEDANISDFSVSESTSIVNEEETHLVEQLNDISRPSCSNNNNDILKINHLKKRKTESASTVYKELAEFTTAKTAKKNYESDYFKLKLAYKKQRFERKLEMDMELFQLEKRKLENDLKLQEIKIEQEMVVLQKMK